jgi:hypothetical protein
MALMSWLVNSFCGLYIVCVLLSLFTDHYEERRSPALIAAPLLPMS